MYDDTETTVSDSTTPLSKKMENTTKENRYYKPSPEEFRIGFRYERGDDGYSWFTDVFPRAVNFPPTSIAPYEEYLSRLTTYCRVKYLDHDDIVECGWKLLRKKDMVYEKAGYYLDILFDESLEVEIYTEHTDGWDEVFFKGAIRNINELQDVMRMVGVK